MKCISALLISVLLTMSSVPAQVPDFDSLRFEELKQLFELDESVQPRLIEIMKMTEAQRRMDIRNYQSGSVALYQVAKVRRNRENQLISELLSREQQRVFMHREHSPQVTELYMWQEGLLLNAAQTQQVSGHRRWSAPELRTRSIRYRDGTPRVAGRRCGHAASPGPGTRPNDDGPGTGRTERYAGSRQRRING